MLLPNRVQQPGRRPAVEERQDLDLAAERLDEPGFWQRPGGVVTAFDEEVGPHNLDEHVGPVFFEGDDKVHAREGGEDTGTIGQAIHGPVSSLEAPHAVVAVQAHDKHVSQGSCFVEHGDVSGVEDIEAAVREDDPLAGRPRSRNSSLELRTIGHQ